MKSQGVLRYSPKLLGNESSSKWWLVMDADEEIGRYYRHLYKLNTFRCDNMQRPAWKEHVTVIRDEEPQEQCKVHWEKHAGLVVEYEYDPSPQTNGEYFWLAVDCPLLLDIREELGLPRHPQWPLHLSIGHNRP